MIENSDWVVLVPYWAVWPYETMILPKEQVIRMQDLSEGKQESLATIMKQLCTRYDNLFKCSFPYSMGWHGEWITPPIGIVRSDHLSDISLLFQVLQPVLT